MEMNPTYEDIVAAYTEKTNALMGENIFLLAKVARMSIYIDQLESELAAFKTSSDIREGTDEE